VSFILFNEYRRIELQYTKFFKQETSTKAFEDTFKVAGLGTFVLKAEGTPISYDDPVQGPRRRVTHSTYALGFRVTEEMMDDDQHGIVSQMPKDLGDSLRDHQEQVAAQVFNTAFVATSFTTMDNVALCSDAHVELRTGATVSNELTPGVALSHAGIESMLIQINTTDNDQGRPIMLTPKNLIIHPNDFYEAQRLLESQHQPGSADNDINTLNRLGVEICPYRYLTDTDNWFIQSSEHKLTWYNRKKPTMDSSSDSQTKDKLFDMRYRASVAAWDWFGINGSSV
jgi:hypothetical protein